MEERYGPRIDRRNTSGSLRVVSSLTTFAVRKVSQYKGSPTSPVHKWRKRKQKGLDRSVRLGWGPEGPSRTTERESWERTHGSRGHSTSVFPCHYRVVNLSSPSETNHPMVYGRVEIFVSSSNKGYIEVQKHVHGRRRGAPPPLQPSYLSLYEPTDHSWGKLSWVSVEIIDFPTTLRWSLTCVSSDFSFSSQVIFWVLYTFYATLSGRQFSYSKIFLPTIS